MTATPRHSWSLEASGFALALTLACLLALALRAYALDGSGLQNDEQLWLARSALFIQSLFGPWAPADLITPEVRWPYEHVDLTGSRWVLSSHWPFTIVMQAPHPGVPVGFFTGLSYLFLAQGSSGWSLNLLSVIAAIRLPTVLLGALLPAVTGLLGRRLYSPAAGMGAAFIIAVEPMLVGYSRLARLDMVMTFWSLCAVLAATKAYQQESRRHAILAGAFAALATTTHTYGLLSVGVAILAGVMLSPTTLRQRMDRVGWRLWNLPSRLDLLFLCSTLGFFILFYPNLWPNPFLGFVKMAAAIWNTPHLQGEASGMPVSRLFYLICSPQHLQPLMLALAGAGTAIALFRRDRRVLFLVLWCAGILLLLSFPSGRKNTKNAIELIPAIAILAGIALDYLAVALARRLPVLTPAAAIAGLCATISLMGIATTRDWLPYPQLYTWSWAGDPQEQRINELIGVGEGIKEAVSYVISHGKTGDVIGAYTGDHIAKFYYPAELVTTPVDGADLENLDWLIVLPKQHYVSSQANPIARWFRARQPDHVIMHNQIALVWIYRLNHSAD